MCVRLAGNGRLSVFLGQRELRKVHYCISVPRNDCFNLICSFLFALQLQTLVEMASLLSEYDWIKKALQKLVLALYIF